MTHGEIDSFLHERRTMSVATIGPGGAVHLVAMWFGFLDDAPAFVTFTKSQKVQNLRRDPRLTALVDDGEAYGELRGVELVGRGVIVDEPGAVMSVARSVVQRYFGVEDAAVEAAATNLARKRCAVRVEADRVVSWDHRRLHGGY